MKRRHSGWRMTWWLTMGFAGLAMGPRPETLTMLVVPARHSVCRVALDMAQRFPVVLVAYQGVPTNDGMDPSLYVWNGNDWADLSLEDFASGRFLTRLPQRTVFVGDETLVPPELLEAASWSPVLLNAPELATPELINTLGGIFGFKRSDWAWFAGRYGLGLEDIHAGERRENWHDQTYREVFTPPPAQRFDPPPPPPPEPRPMPMLTEPEPAPPAPPAEVEAADERP